jgi:hypothetical protein
MGTTPTRKHPTFDRAEVTRCVAEQRNRLWQSMVAATFGNRLNSWENISRRDTIQAAVELRVAIGRVLEEIGHFCGANGELLDPADFIKKANEAARDFQGYSHVPDANPNRRMVDCVTDVWKEWFFQPQHENIQRMIDGILRAAQTSARAKDRADELLLHLRQSTIERYDETSRRLLDEVVHYLNVFLPEANSDSTEPSDSVIVRRDAASGYSGTNSTEDIAKLLRLFTGKISDERIDRASAVLASHKTVNEKLEEMDRELPIPPTTSSQDLAGVLGVSKTAIMKSAWWQQNRRGSREETIEARREKLMDKGRRLEAGADERRR